MSLATDFQFFFRFLQQCALEVETSLPPQPFSSHVDLLGNRLSACLSLSDLRYSLQLCKKCLSFKLTFLARFGFKKINKQAESDVLRLARKEIWSVKFIVREIFNKTQANVTWVYYNRLA